MKPSFAQYEQTQTPQCCFLSLCRKQQKTIPFNKNTNGLKPNSPRPIFYNKNNVVASQVISNQNQPQLKRSISALKIKKRGEQYQTISIKNQRPSDLKINKFIRSSMDPDILKSNYFEDNPFNSYKGSTQKLNGNAHVNTHNYQLKNGFDFKKQKYQISKLTPVGRKQFFSPRHLVEKPLLQTQQTNYQIRLNRQLQNKHHQQKHSNDYPKGHQRQIYQAKEIHFFSKISQNLNQSNVSQKRSLKLEVPKPVMPFQQITSFIQASSKIHSKNNDQDQFDSIRTKGKPVQSMLYISTNLKKTKKRNKFEFAQRQKNMQNLQNRTVYSEYQSEQGDQVKRQTIQQSAVLVNFFHPPSHIKETLNLSTRNYH